MSTLGLKQHTHFCSDTYSLNSAPWNRLTLSDILDRESTLLGQTMYRRSEWRATCACMCSIYLEELCRDVVSRPRPGFTMPLFASTLSHAHHAVWTLYQKGAQDDLEKVQKCAARWICAKWDKANYCLWGMLFWFSLGHSTSETTPANMLSGLQNLNCLRFDLLPGLIDLHCIVQVPEIGFPF